MAFKVRKAVKREDGDMAVQEDTASSIGFNQGVVATQRWVGRVLRGIWDWRRFFATESIQVAGGVSSQTIQSHEAQIDDIYARRLILSDPYGRPAVIYIGDDGDLHREYDFHDAYVYPGSGTGVVDVRNFIYTKPDIAANFAGLTPYEILLNFAPFSSTQTRELNDVVCPMLCPADGGDEPVDKTLLFACPRTKKIQCVEILDADGELLDTIYTLPEDSECRILTVNMPSFIPSDGSETIRVPLPDSRTCPSSGDFKPFVPPYLLPPKPPFFPMPTDDLFNDDDDAQGDSTSSSEALEHEFHPIRPGYEVAYENYSTSTYVNIALKRGDFRQNVEQFLHIKVVDC